MKQFHRFLAVGALGFLVDFSVLYLAVHYGKFGLISGRVLSFIVAATVTWKINRQFTFPGAHVATAICAVRQWLRYMCTTAIGGAINIGIYQVWLNVSDYSTVNLFLATVAGSAIALAVNFTLSKYIVFSR